MLIDLYVFGSSPVHRMRPVVKMAMLVVLCSSVFIAEGWLSLSIAAGLVVLGFVVAGLKLHHALRSLQPALWVLVAIFVVQVVLADISLASFVVGRFVVLILAAALVTLTTTASEFVDGIKSALKFAPRWVPKEKIALSISLCLRFIPLISMVLIEIREAQHARGVGGNPIALLVPLVVRTLKTADEVSEAIYSRSLD